MGRPSERRRSIPLGTLHEGMPLGGADARAALMLRGLVGTRSTLDGVVRQEQVEPSAGKTGKTSGRDEAR